jgi:hypothetical protein
MRPEQQKQKVANEQEKKLSVVMQVAAFTKKRAQESAKHVVCTWGTIQQHAR